jgi:hypothetical protein
MPCLKYAQPYTAYTGRTVHSRLISKYALISSSNQDGIWYMQNKHFTVQHVVPACACKCTFKE